MKDTIFDSVFYHIYPLGMCGCAKRNDFSCPAGSAFSALEEQLPRIRELGCNALYVGPLFESSSHGYDTVDYYHVDRRLGNNESFKHFCNAAHEMGFKVVLDAVFNHTGRDFFAFKDIQSNGSASRYCSWYKNLNFGQRSCYGDNFDYEGWAGCKDLVKLNGECGQVQEHLFGAVKFWIEEFKIDGLRLDAADVLSANFMENLSKFCASIKQDFWLLGEVVHGDYNYWVRPSRLHSVTNYECYKGLWSSFNSRNFFEIAYSLNRQFGNSGIYKFMPLYNFVENHDVDRVASVLSDSRWLFPLYGLLFAMPGVPSIYYGGEYGLRGKRNNSGDEQLRPSFGSSSNLDGKCRVPDFAKPDVDSLALAKAIQKFASIRLRFDALKKGSYSQIFVSSCQFVFEREFYGQRIIVAVNCEDKPACVCLRNAVHRSCEDVLNGGIFCENDLNRLEIPANWLRILKC